MLRLRAEDRYALLTLRSARHTSFLVILSEAARFRAAQSKDPYNLVHCVTSSGRQVEARIEPGRRDAERTTPEPAQSEVEGVGILTFALWTMRDA